MGVLRANVSGTWVDIGQTTDVRVWNGAWGDVAQSQIIVAQSGITAETVLTGSAITVATIAGRRYRISINCSPNTDTVGNSCAYNIRRDGTTIGGRAMTFPAVGSQEFHLESTHIETVSGNRTFDVTLQRSGGTGTVGNFAAAVTPTWVTIEDMGPTAVTVLPPQPLVANPGNALGIIAVGVPVNRAGAALANTNGENLGPPINCYTQVGRRYRFVANGMRAATASPATWVALYFTGPGITSRVDWYRLLSSAYDALSAEVVFDGQGSVGTYTVQVAAGGAGVAIWTEQQATYYIEDCGPISPVGVADIVESASVPWLPLPLATGWSNYGGGYENGQYRKVGDEVQLRGLLSQGTGVTSLIATLPVGYRPSATVLCIVIPNNAPTVSNIRMDINPSGTMIYTPVAVGQWVSLSGQITFSTTA